MRPTFLGFETQRKAIITSQKGLDITGHNLSNATTAGYTRQRIDQVSIAPNSYRSRYAYNRTEFAGQGVNISGVAQVRDPFLDKRFRDQYGEAEYYNQSSTILSDIQSILNETQDKGLEGELNTLIGKLNKWSENAYSETDASLVREEFKALTQMLREMDTKLNRLTEQYQDDLQIAVDDVNTLFEKLAGLNEAIVEDLGVTSSVDGEYYGPNELLDERNMLLDELSRYGDLEVTNHSDGAVTVKMNGKTVVEGKKHTTMNLLADRENGTVKVTWADTGEDINMTKGYLKASIDVLNGRGVNIKNSGETSTNGMLYYKDKLNAFAKTLAKEMNAILPQTDDPNQTRLLLGARVMGPDGKYVTTNDVEVTAGNIFVSDEWMNDATFAIPEDASKANDLILKMKETLVSGSVQFGEEGQKFEGTFHDFVRDFVGTLGSDVNFNNTRLDATGTLVDEINNQRDSVSGVSEVEETTNMLMYSKSFQAASRMLTTMDEALDVLINKTGLVGR